MNIDKNKIIKYLKNNTLSIFILLTIILYMIARWNFSQGTVNYRVESMDQIDTLTEKIDQLTEEIQELEIKIDELER